MRRRAPARRHGAGAAQARQPARSPHASVAGSQGRIVFVGPAHEVAAAVRLGSTARRSSTPAGCTVVPGFVDPHTHLVFAGDRRDELRAPAGRRDLRRDRRRAAAASSRPSPRRAPPARRAGRRAPARGSPRCSRCGTTTAEVKSGYGLDARRRAAHAARDPRARRGAADRAEPRRSWARTRCRSSTAADRDEYVRLVVDEMLPAVAAEGLAEWCDVFCEHGVFTPGRVAATSSRPGAATG